MVYLRSLSYIDWVSYIHFKTKHNLNLLINEYELNAWPILDIMLIFLCGK